MGFPVKRASDRPTAGGSPPWVLRTLAISVVVLATAAIAVAVTGRPSRKLTCVQVRFPAESLPEAEFAFATGLVKGSPGFVESAYSGERHLLALKLHSRADAERIRNSVDGLPLLVTGLGASTTALVSASTVACVDIKDQFGRCESSPGHLRCTASAS